ncbi:MAG: sigma-70 family RNA polymerase sigma factor [Ruminococcus sp.]|nr:sigma-70 family RNA polymerase sigma factor [Ruminococcus sp.]
MDKNKLINDNYQNIYKLAQRISKTYGLPFDVFEDLQKEGYISLIEQYESYNENSEASFWTYAYKGVRNKMLSAVQFYFNTVTIPEHLNRQFTAINRIKARNPELTDIQLTNVISEEMKISAEKAEELLVLSAKEKVSIDKCDENDTPLIELFSDDEYRPDKKLFDDGIPIDMDTLMKIIETELTPRQADYIKMYFGIGCTRMTYEEIGEEFCVSAKAVEKSLKNAIEIVGKSVIK